jgi:hypothetical protein
MHRHRQADGAELLWIVPYEGVLDIASTHLRD